MCLTWTIVPGQSTPPVKESVKNKPLKIGLVLSGGGAWGIAHVGVIEWLEEHRIPVHYITGTSMGGLVGAVYSMGMPVGEMRPFLKSLNWDELLSARPSFDQLAFRRKEDLRSYQIGLEMGYRKGLSLPIGVSSAHYLGMLFDRIALPYSGLSSFDQLPIPFRCVATDFLEAKPVTLKDGPLSSAMRATMSIPGVFPPVERNGMVLVDGGMLNNIPTDVMKEFSPDVIIAVDVGARLGDNQAAASLIGIVGQSLSVMMIENARRNLRLADIIISPELGNLGTLDFTKIEETADIGYRSAEQKAAILTRFSVDQAEWQEYLAQRKVRIRTTTPVPDSIHITGVTGEKQEALADQLEKFSGRQLNDRELESTLTRITGQGRYQSLDYNLVPNPDNPDKASLEIRAIEKTHAPPTIHTAFEIDGSDINAINFTIGTRVTLYDVGGYGSEWRNDVRIGFGNLIATEYFRPIGENGFFIAPRALYRRDRQNIFIRGSRFADYEADRLGAGFDAGILSMRNELRFGYEYTRVSARSRTGLTALPAITGNVNLARLRWAFDGQNSPTIPTRGLHLSAEGRWFLGTPEGENNIKQAELRGSYFQPVTTIGSLFIATSAGTSFNKNSPFFQEYRIGGPFRYGALDRDEMRVDHYALATLGYLHKLYQLPSLVGGKVYAGGWIDQLYTSGGLTATFDSQRFRTAGSIGLVMDSKVGPFSIVGSYGEGGRGKIYFALGRFF